MKERFEDEDGRRLLFSLLLKQKIVAGASAIADALTHFCEVIELQKGVSFIKENASDNDVYFLLVGKVKIVVKGRQVNERQPGDHIGEMAAIDPSLPRSATCVTDSICVLAKITEASLSKIAAEHPDLWRNLAKELAQRLSQRNRLIPSANERPKAFVMCSVEALSIAHEIQSGLQHDALVTVWTNGVF